MFKTATKQQYDYLSWIKTISMEYGTKKINIGGASFFFVNEDGWAITCKHVAEYILNLSLINQNYNNFKVELNNNPTMRQQLEKKYNLNADTICQCAYQFSCDNILNTNSSITSIAHPTLDIAILKFDLKEKVPYCYFVDDMSDIEQGTILARIGFPFIYFNNYNYNNKTDTLSFMPNKQPMVTFVNDGIVSQNIGNENGRTHFILSSPGIKGQSGGPIYDVQGRIAGIQSLTDTKDLDFIGEKVINNQTILVPQFLNVGICVSSEPIKAFLDKNKVKYYVK